METEFNAMGLGGCTRSELVHLWRDLQGRPPPKNLSKPIMSAALAFELQVQQHGGVKQNTLRQLEALTRSREDAVPAKSKLQIGTRLVREWKGRTWTVEVTADGFVMNGNTHDSLSACAKLITGAHWSGPRFFGLTKAKVKYA